jgi:hypothetical protein
MRGSCRDPAKTLEIADQQRVVIAIASSIHPPFAVSLASPKLFPHLTVTRFTIG